jgi:hypothetical protein
MVLNGKLRKFICNIYKAESITMSAEVNDIMKIESGGGTAPCIYNHGKR